MNLTKKSIIKSILVFILAFSLTACNAENQQDNNDDTQNNTTAEESTISQAIEINETSSAPVNELKAGDMIYFDFMTDAGSDEPAATIWGIQFGFKGDTSANLPTMKNLNIYKNNVQISTPENQFGPVTYYGTTDNTSYSIEFSYAYGEEINEFPAEYYFTLDLNGTTIRSNTYNWRADGVLECLWDQPVWAFNLPATSDNISNNNISDNDISDDTIVMPDGTFDGDMNGFGIWNYRNIRYEGEFLNGKPNGNGTLYVTMSIDMQVEVILTGTWLNGMANGDITMTQASTNSDWKASFDNFKAVNGTVESEISIADPELQYVVTLDPNNTKICVAPWGDIQISYAWLE